MRVQLKKRKEIRGEQHKAGDVINVRKDEGDRLVEAGVATRVIEEVENRIVGTPSNRGVRRFCEHQEW
jgi:hypothetical protein